MTTDPTFVLYDIPEEEEIEIPDPSISVEVDEPEYGKFIIEPLEPGYGVTLGNPMRRVLYNGLDGSAITSVKIEGVQHEYQTIPNVREQVTEILLNVKAVRLRSEVDRPGTLRLEVAGEGQVSAADIMASADFEVVNPELHLATLDSQDARISVELNVERGKGYLEKPEGESQTIGVLPVDAIFSPTRKVNYTVERTRVGQRTNFERLILEVWTDGSLTPVEAVRKASNILVNQFFLFANTEQTAEEGVNGRTVYLAEHSAGALRHPCGKAVPQLAHAELPEARRYRQGRRGTPDEQGRAAQDQELRRKVLHGTV